jgi:alpha-tubulin suppressor-like RCC1 family protein
VLGLQRQWRARKRLYDGQFGARSNHGFCKRRNRGGVVCWGDNSHGELWNCSRTSSSVPVPVPVPVAGLTGGVTAISVGGDSACAILAGGSLRCWGYNGFGQVGNGSTTDSLVPVRVSGL